MYYIYILYVHIIIILELGDLMYSKVVLHSKMFEKSQQSYTENKNNNALKFQPLK